jgi:hypothetical protein
VLEIRKMKMKKKKDVCGDGRRRSEDEEVRRTWDEGAEEA